MRGPRAALRPQRRDQQQRQRELPAPAAASQPRPPGPPRVLFSLRGSSLSPSKQLLHGLLHGHLSADSQSRRFFPPLLVHQQCTAAGYAALLAVVVLAGLALWAGAASRGDVSTSWLPTPSAPGTQLDSPAAPPLPAADVAGLAISQDSGSVVPEKSSEGGNTPIATELSSTEKVPRQEGDGGALSADVPNKQATENGKDEATAEPQVQGPVRNEGQQQETLQQGLPGAAPHGASQQIGGLRGTQVAQNSAEITRPVPDAGRKLQTVWDLGDADTSEEKQLAAAYLDAGPGDGRTAVCLVGGARTFEATGPSILKNLLEACEPQPCDLFLNAPLDQNSAKLWILKHAPSIASWRIFPDSDIDERIQPGGLFGTFSAPGGLQGLLQNFKMTETCIKMILKHEQRIGAKYSWIMRGRLDAFWSAPVPSPTQFQPDAYMIPHGSDWGGINDRFGMGTRWPTTIALKRLTVLPDVKKQVMNVSIIPCERAFQLQFEISNVSYERADFPFCLLTHRKDLPNRLLGQPDAPLCETSFMSLHQERAMGGAYCKPCLDCNSLAPGHADPEAEGYRTCNITRDPWEPGAWQDRYEAVAGAEQRRMLDEVSSTGLIECVRQFTELFSRVQLWDAPPPASICVRSRLGVPTVWGEGQGAFGFFLDALPPTGTVLVPEFPVPPPITRREATFWELVVKATFPHHIQISRPELSEDDLGELTREKLNEWGHVHVDVLKLPAGLGMRVLNRWIERAEAAASSALSFPPLDLPICQLLVTLPSHVKQGEGGQTMPRVTTWHFMRSIVPRLMDGLGLQLHSCVWGNQTVNHVERCTFFSVLYCNKLFKDLEKLFCVDAERVWQKMSLTQFGA